MQSLKERDNNFKFGKEVFDKYGEDLPSSAFRSQEYRESYNRVKIAKKDVDKANFQLRSASDILTTARTYGTKEEIAKAEALYEKAYKNNRTAEGALSDAKEKHELIKTRFKSDAKLENAHKYYKDTTSDIDFINDSTLENSVNKNNRSHSQQDEINDTLQQILQSQRGNSNRVNQDSGTTAGSTIIIPDTQTSQPRQEATSQEAIQDEHSRLVNQYNNETDPNKKAAIRKQIDDFERRH